MITPFMELGLVIVTAGICGLIARTLKQPPLLGFIVAGFTLGPVGYKLIHNQELLAIFSEIGIALLLFLVGLELNWRSISKIGFKAINLAVLQIVLTFALGYSVGLFFDFNPFTAIIIGLALTFSSTIVVLKLISEKNDIQSLYGKISVALLLIQDVVAVLTLVFLTGAKVDRPFASQIISLSGQFLVLFAAAWFTTNFVLPKLFRWLAKSRDLMVLIAIGWCFLFAMAAQQLGFSYAIGAFLAGLTLAAIPYNLDIIGQVRPLRDFFIVMFFVLLGFTLNPQGAINWPLVATLTGLAVIVKPLIIFISLAAQKMKARTSFFASFSLGQMSEFSVILSVAALNQGLISESQASSITVATAITLALSSYLITAAERVYNVLKPVLALVQTPGTKFTLESTPEQRDHVIIFGYHRMGYHILKTLRKLKQEVLIVDFNPDVIERLRGKQIPSVFGDASDPELLETVHLKQARIVISTIPHLEDNLVLIRQIRQAHRGIIMIATASDIGDAIKLYKAGADYVILPQMLSGEHLADLLEKSEAGTLKRYLSSRKNEAKLLKTSSQDLYY